MSNRHFVYGESALKKFGMICVLQHESIIRALYSRLIRLSGDPDPEIIQTCAECLGELGAIDLANWETQEKDRKKNEVSDVPFDAKDFEMEKPEYFVNHEEFAMELIKKYLVPILKSPKSTREQHGAQFAIQV